MTVLQLLSFEKRKSKLTGRNIFYVYTANQVTHTHTHTSEAHEIILNHARAKDSDFIWKYWFHTVVNIL